MKESFRPFEESSIWDSIATFYTERGLESWASGTVPSRISSNAWIADAYAEIIAAFMRDLEAAGSTARPLVVELGAGSGLLGWHWTRRLAEISPDDDLPVDVLLTETSAAHARAWLGEPRMARWFARPEIHLGVLRVDETPPTEVVDLDGVPVPLTDRPVVVIANYVFDSVPTDMLLLREGRVHRVHVALEGEVRERESGRPDLSGLEVRTEDRPIPTDVPITGHPLVDREIEGYRRRGATGYVPVPVKVIRFLGALSDGADPTLVLTGDLAITIEAFPDEVPLLHHAYVACRTNFDLLGRVFEARGATAVFPRAEDSDFVVGAFLRGGNVALGRCEEAARARLLGFGPPDAQNLDDLILAHEGELESWTALAWLRMAGFDPVSVEGAIPHLDRSLEAGKTVDRTMLREALLRALRNDLPSVTGTDQLATKATLVLARAGLHEAVLDGLEEVARDELLTPAQLHLRALAEVRLGRTPEAAAALTDLLARAPGYWSGWPDGDGPANPDALAAAPDVRHLDHVMLHLSVARLMGGKTR